MKNPIKKITLFCIEMMFTLTLSAQNNQHIEGKVVDVNNEPIIGATIISTEQVGTTTDFDGNFTLSVREGTTITISYVGYSIYQEKITASKNFYRIVLQEDNELLEEVIVVGYGTQKRSDLTGSISSVRTDEIKDFSSKSLAESLSGMAAGVTVTKGSGSPGESADILIRGAGSLNGMSPLYVVDGVAQEAGFTFNMRDVESIEILKDAGSAAIYGSRAAGGVILITTKRGKGGKATINANARFGIRNITNKIKLLNTADWIRARDAFGNSNTLDLLGETSIDQLPNTDWMDVMFGTGTEQEYNLSLTASSEKVNFFLSGSYLNEKGVYMDTSAERFSFRNNLDYKFNQYITIGESIYGSSNKSNPATNSSIYNHTIPFRTVPVATVYDEDGNYAKTPSVGSGPNFAGMEHAFHQLRDNNYNLTGQVYLDINVLKGLNWHTTGAGTFNGFSRNTFTEYKDFGQVQVGLQGGTLDAYAGTSQNLMFNSVLTYGKSWGDHNFKVMGGTEWWKLDGYELTVAAYDFKIPVAESIELGSAGPTKSASDRLPAERRGSYFGRLNYDYQGKYLLTVNFRADGSDRFVKKNRWGYFPSVNAGWRVSEENFVKPYTENWLDNAKIRFSWGILGNDAIAQYMYESTYSLSGISHSFDNTSIQQSGAWLAVFGNEGLKWEEVNQIDLGIDFVFLNNRLTFTYDYYNRQTKDMLYAGSLPLSAGMSYYFDSLDPANTVPVYFNAGLVENKGHEISIGWKERRHDFTYSVSANASFNSNKVKQVGDKPGATTIDEGLDAAWPLLARTEDGQPMSMFYGYEVLGIFQNQAQVDQYNQYALDNWMEQNPNHPYGYDPVTGQPLNGDGNPIGIYYQKEQTGVGDLIFSDNGEGRVTPLSRKYIGNPWPKMTLGLNISLEYKGFDLSAVFQGAFGFDIMNLVKPYTQMFSSDNTTADIFKTSCFGAGNTTVTDFPRVGYINEKGSFIGDGAANKNYSTVSGYLVEKGNYLKLKNLSVGYSLPKTIANKVFLENARVYISMQNVFTITNYTGIDPEIGGGVLMRNVDNQNRYLPSRLISFGLDLTF